MCVTKPQVLLPVGVTFPYWVSFLETHSPPFQVGRRRLPFQASLATLVLVRPSCILWRLGDVIEREWLSRRLDRGLQTPRHLSRRSLCHRTHTVVLFHRRHLLLRQRRG
ncbi:hypothetical protein Taro_013499 [Colocasia esculenta]|uniref:Uncharacterized protein n=1 Tax=Colocasia esculenta TaxID=4460 RepID=A0A843UC72_COLES|nr:hypothetical protein [Colocasia esculenta]